MEAVSNFEDIFDGSKITTLPAMNIPRIVNWLNDLAPASEDPFSTPTIAEAISLHGIESIRKIPRINEHSNRKEPPFYGAQVILKSGDKFRVSYEIDLWITYESLIAAFRTHDSTPETSKYHEEFLLAQYQFDLNATNATNLEEQMQKRLMEIPFEMRANLRLRYQEKIADANLFQQQLSQQLDQARNRYVQSKELDAREREQEHEYETTQD